MSQRQHEQSHTLAVVEKEYGDLILNSARSRPAKSNEERFEAERNRHEALCVTHTVGFPTMLKGDVSCNDQFLMDLVVYRHSKLFKGRKKDTDL